ncbi:30S ribosomal protein S20 [bacterium]|nr:30S ribosomal protein S20 [bacterium]
MPNVKSAKKRVKTNERDRLRNRQARSSMWTAIRKVLAGINGSNPDAVKTALPVALSEIGKCGKKGMIHANKAARLESRLVRKANVVLGSVSQ